MHTAVTLTTLHKGGLIKVESHVQFKSCFTIKRVKVKQITKDTFLDLVTSKTQS